MASYIKTFNVVCVDSAAKADLEKLKKDIAARGKYRYVLHCFINKRSCHLMSNALYVKPVASVVTCMHSYHI